MKGYFSRIAKQSGLRFSGQDSPRPAANEPVAGAAPLHTEETVMVPPQQQQQQPQAEKTETRAKTRAKTPRPDRGEIPRRTAAPESELKKQQPGREEIPGRVKENPASEAKLENRQAITVPEYAADLSQSFEKEDSAEAGKSTERLSVIEQTVFIDPPRSPEAIKQESTPLTKEPVELKDQSETETLIVSETPKKGYFSKTAEVIEKGGVETEEIHRILFQDVQQWVADSPLAGDKPEPASREEGREEEYKEMEISLTKEVFQTQPREKTPVREIAGRENIERVEFAEQSFDLSIGTISVVIEEAEKLPQPPPPPVNNRPNAAGETKREYSRLSRHYL